MNDIYNSSAAFLIEAFRKIRQVVSPITNTVRENKELITGSIYTIMDVAAWIECTKKAAERGIVLTESIPTELALKIYDTPDDKIESIVDKYYFDDCSKNFRVLLNKCKQSNYLTDYSILFNEIINSFNAENYHLACIGLFAVSDGLLADISNMVDSTAFRKRINQITKQITDEQIITNASKSTISVCNFFDTSNNYFDVSPFKNAFFSDDEPLEVNRHWAVHGRSRRTYSRLDFLKILLWIDALTILADISKETTCEESL